MVDKIEWKRPLKETKTERAAGLRQAMIVGAHIVTFMTILPGAIAMGVSEHSAIMAVRLFVEMAAGTAALFVVFHYALIALVNLLVQTSCSIQANGVKILGELWSWHKFSGYNITTSREVPGAMDINFCRKGFKIWMSVPFHTSDVDERALREAIERHVPYMELPADNPTPFTRPDPTRPEVLKSVACTAILSLASGIGTFWIFTHSAINGEYLSLGALFGFTFIGSILLFWADVVRYVRLRWIHREQGAKL